MKLKRFALWSLVAATLLGAAAYAFRGPLSMAVARRIAGERLAATLQRASDDADGDALKSRMLGSVAQGLTTASDALRQKSVSDLTADVRTLARKHPGAFMVAAAVAGFAVARFVRSSSQRREPRV